MVLVVTVPESSTGTLLPVSPEPKTGAWGGSSLVQGSTTTLTRQPLSGVGSLG